VCELFSHAKKKGKVDYFLILIIGTAPLQDRASPQECGPFSHAKNKGKEF
jgi:hypothetical protein